MQKRIYYYLLAFLIPFSFIYLTGCDLFGKPSGPVTPPKIEIIGPSNASIFPIGTDVVTIHGRIIKGTNPIKLLKVRDGLNWSSIPYNPETMEFTYDFELDPDRYYSTCSLEVCDTALISNMERVSYLVGDSAVHGDIPASDDALSISMTENFINGLITIVEGFVNTYLPDVIATLLPIYYKLGFPLTGQLVIDENASENPGAVEIEGVNVDYVDCMAGDRIKIGFGLEKFLVKGYHDRVILWNVPFSVSSGDAGVHNIVVGLSINENDDIVANIDLSDIEITLDNATLHYGFLTIPSWLTGMVADIAEDILRLLPEMNIPIMDTKDFVVELGDLNFAIWSMDPEHVFTTTEDSMTFDLGISVTLDDFYNAALYPDSDEFLITPYGEMPDVSASPSGDDMVVAVSDELINQGAFTIVQSGLLKDLDLSAAGSAGSAAPGDIDLYLEITPLKINVGAIASLIPVGNTDITLKVSIETPPVCDFSGEGIPDAATESFGTFIIPNVIIEMGNIKLTPTGKAMTIKLGVDITATLGMDISGNVITGKALIDMSQFDVEVLYFSEPLGSALLNPLLDIGLGLARLVSNNVIKGIVEIELPENDVFTMPELEFTGNQFIDNYLVIGLTSEF